MTDQTPKKTNAGADLPQRDPNLGKIVNSKWRIQEQLGKGGAGIVYSCEHITTGQTAAVKLLRTSWEENEELLNRFFREVQILRRLRHPNIVEIFDVGFQEEAGFFLVMERLDGCDLRSRIEQDPHPLPWRELAHIANQVCEAMSFAHDKGVIHRDLKPANIFLLNTSNGQPLVKLLDFGIAKALTEDDTQITQTGMMVGSPAYLAPEQAMGFPVDERADLYSLSVILFELLTQKSLFQQDNSFRYMMHHVYTPPRTLSQTRPDIHFPPALEQLVADGLSKEPAARPSDMLVFKKRLLDAFMGRMPTSQSNPAVEPPGTYRVAKTEPESLQPSPQQIHIRQAKLQLKDGTSDTVTTSTPAALQTPTPLPIADQSPVNTGYLISGSDDDMEFDLEGLTIEEDMDGLGLDRVQEPEPTPTPLPSPQALTNQRTSIRTATPLPRNDRNPPRGPKRGPDQREAPTAPPASLAAPRNTVSIRSRGESLANQLAPPRATPMRGTPSVSRSRRNSSAVWKDTRLDEQRKRRNYLLISFAAITLILLITAVFIGR